MADNTGIKMRIIALDELMKCCAEIGRHMEDSAEKELVRRLFEAAKTRRDFLSASRGETDKD